MEKSKTHIIWIAIFITLVVSVIIFIPNLKKQKCNIPYIQVGTSCCIDKNSNDICDNDEQVLELQDSCGDTLCQDNEKAPDCSDCKPNIRIENLQYNIFKPSGRLDSQEVELKITNYDIIQMGDPVVIYPSLDIYQGISEEQCKNKNSMSLFKENLFYQERSSLIDKESYYNLDYKYKLEGLNSTYSCIYFVFELKPYPTGGINYFESEKILAIAQEESQIIPVNKPYKSKLDIKNEQQ